jgi:transposase
MRQVREVLRLRFALGRSQRQIQAATGLSAGAVCDYLKRARKAGLTWDVAQTLGDAEVEARLFAAVGRNDPKPRAPIDFAWVHGELRRAGVTLLLLWDEYRAGVASRGDGSRAYQYSQFCELYATWRSHLAVSMRQVHRAGEKVFVDYSGKKPHIVDPKTGEVSDVELFVAVLGASNYTFAEATRTQRLADFTESLVRAFEFFGGVPQVVVPDQLKSAVAGSDWFDPDLNPTLVDLATHYGTVIVPARPRRPRDKAKAEAAVQLVQRWIVARLRHRTFFSLEELNFAIADLLDELNARPFKRLEGCRRTAFETLDRPELRPLPPTRFQRSEWKKAKVHPDYHVAFEDRFYSVPSPLVGQRVEIRATARTVEVLHRGIRVAAHARSYGPKGTAITLDAHKPKSHRDYGQWPPERMRAWADTIGPSVRLVVDAMMARYPRPEMAYRAVFALTRDARTYSPARLDAACARALALSGPWGPTRKSILAILSRGLDSKPLHGADARPQLSLPAHDNVRGAAYFDKEEDTC